ncbi:MAG: hypothetical protein WBE41_17345, partial [Terracidiphilus sp.]
MSHGLLGGLFGRQQERAAAAVIEVEESVAIEDAVDRSFEYALDALPANAMFCDRELILRYLNR